MNRIRYYRLAQGLLQKDLAKAVGVSNGHLSHLERGTRNPSTATMALIAEALGKTVSEVFYFTETHILRKEVDTMKLQTMYQEEPTNDLVVIEDGRAITTSLKVADYFGKRHADVLRGIENIVNEIPTDFTQRNFALSDYTDPTGRCLPMYLLTRDGFVLVAMGYTGAKAMQFKVAYITAFNKMEAILQRRPEPLTNEEIVDRAANKLATKLFPEFMKTVSKQLGKDIVEQVRSLPHGETLIPTAPAVSRPQKQTTQLIVSRPSLDWLPNVLTVDQVKTYLDIGQVQAYELFHSEGFPSIKVGGSLKVEKYLFIKWLDEQAQL